MRFWDSSALLPIIVNEESSDEIARLLALDAGVAVWWGSRVECMSALARKRREGTLDGAFLDRSRRRFDLLFDDAFEIEPTSELGVVAEDLSSEVALKAADVLQLAAAIVWRGEDAPGMEFVCLDGRLRDAATSREFAPLPQGRTV